MSREAEDRALAVLPKRHQDLWDHEYRTALDQHESEGVARQRAWRSIGVAAIPVDGQFVRIEEVLGL